MPEISTKIAALLKESYLMRSKNLLLSQSLSNRALEMSTEIQNENLMAKSLSQLSLYHMILGNYDQSFNLSQKSILLFEKCNDENGIAEVKYNLAGFYYKSNNFQMGVVNLIDALKIFKKNNDYHYISKCEKALGSLYEFIDDQDKALNSYKNAIKAAKKANDLNLESNVFNNLSGIYIKNGKIDFAKEIIEKSISIKQKNEDIRGLAFAIYGRAKVNLFLKNYDLAEEELLKSITIHKEMGEKLGLAMAYNKLARLFFDKKRIDLSKDALNAALEICNLYNFAIVKIKVLYLFYTIFKFENNSSKALEYLELSVTEKESVLNAKVYKAIENYDLLLRMQTLQKETEEQQEKTKLIAKNTKAEESARVRQEFLSTMSHEIRTPLNAVITIAAMLGENKKDDEKVLVDSLLFSCNHLKQIINNILDFTKLDNGKVNLELQAKNLKSLLEVLGHTYQIQVKEKSIGFDLNLDPDLAQTYFIDETKITQILSNLIHNAIKFTDFGKVVLDVTVVSKEKQHDIVLFKVLDTGIGIENEYLSKVFDGFSQLKKGITRKKDGTGLGLTISKKLIDLHKSEISIESILGKGSVFSFELMLKRGDGIEVVNPLSSDEKFKGLHVLLVEDNAINAMVAKKVLSKWEITTDHAVNGLIATEKSKSLKYDCILMDIHMPVLDGYQAAKNIRTLDNLNKETPIFALTADIAAKDSNYNIYFNDLLIKPLEIDKLKLALSFKNPK